MSILRYLHQSLHSSSLACFPISRLSKPAFEPLYTTSISKKHGSGGEDLSFAGGPGFSWAETSVAPTRARAMRASFILNSTREIFLISGIYTGRRYHSCVVVFRIILTNCDIAPSRGSNPRPSANLKYCLTKCSARVVAPPCRLSEYF